MEIKLQYDILRMSSVHLSDSEYLEPVKTLHNLEEAKIELFKLLLKEKKFNSVLLIHDFMNHTFHIHNMYKQQVELCQKLHADAINKYIKLHKIRVAKYYGSIAEHYDALR